MNLSRQLAKFVADTRYEHLPQNVVETAKKSLLDALGVMLAASTLGDGCEAMVKTALASGGKEESTVIGFGVKAPAPIAAFANGALSHAMDFEDTHDRAFVHSNAAAIPAALALAEATGPVSGKQLLTAIVVGSELVCRLGLSIQDNLLENGWYMPPIFGAFGAAASASKILKLSTEQILDAFSLVLCQATCSAELTQNPKSLIRSVRDAFSAQSGVLSALLAKEGVTGFERPFDGKLGFFHAYARGRYDQQLLVKDLGNTYEAAQISFKAWPSCRGTHPYIEGALQLMTKHNLQVRDIREIRVVVSPVNRMLCEPLADKRRPASPINAKFSIPFAVGTALHYGDVELKHFFPEALNCPDVLEIADKVQFEVDESLNLKESLRGYIELHSDRQTFSTVVSVPYGDPTHPMEDERLVQKFHQCASYAAAPIAKNDLNELVETILHLEAVADIKEITRYLHQTGKRSVF